MNTDKKDIYTVSRLNREVSQCLTQQFPLLWLEGEIANFTHARSGHMYFSLQDANAQLRAAMFRNNNVYLRMKPTVGMQVLVRARVALFEPRGDFQLIVEHMEEAGDGALRRAFEQLKQTLHAEGLFADSRKQALPEFPQRLGIITSASGAALHDVLTVLQRRYPLLPALIYPVLVQGNNAAQEICAAIELATQRQDCDVLLLTRGGGGLEDLQAFNNETVARAIAACPIPLVSAIGHEIDFTIADFVADLRAATPSAAAELISPDGMQLAQQLRQSLLQLQRCAENYTEYYQDQLHNLQQRLRLVHPQQQLNQKGQRLDELETRLRREVTHYMQRQQERLLHSQTRLYSKTPAERIQQLKIRIEQIQRNLLQHSKTLLEKNCRKLDALMSNLHTVSPLNTLQRGYAIVTRRNETAPLRKAKEIAAGEQLNINLADGSVPVTVEE